MSQKVAKSLLRKQIKKVIALMSEAEKLKQSAVVFEKLLHNPIYNSSQRISIFLSMNDEIQTFEIMKNAFATGKTLFIPRYEKTSNKMDMIQLYSLEDYENLPMTAWNIKQPLDSDNRPEALDTGGLELILIPGLAFSMDGKRLGRGRGYYDTYLSRCMDACKSGLVGHKPMMLGLAFSQQISDEVPVDEHDFMLDEIIQP